MELSEVEFSQFIKEVKSSPLLKELIPPGENRQISLWEYIMRPSEKLPGEVIAILDLNEIYFISDNYKGQYNLNRKKLKELRKGKAFDFEKANKLNSLQRKVRLINSRRSIVYEILKGIAVYQNDYLQSGQPKDLKPLNQVKLAKLSGINHSLISRVLDGQKVLTPKQKILPLKFFFTSPGFVWKIRIRKLLSRGETALTDEEIKHRLEKKYGSSIARRTINKYRKSLDIKTQFLYSML